MRGEIGADRLAVLLAHVFRAALGEQARHLVAQYLHFCGREKAREEEVTLALEVLDLLWCQSHLASFAASLPRQSAQAILPPRHAGLKEVYDLLQY
jgi:hypothetical protein